jgi:hypothetical protein
LIHKDFLGFWRQIRALFLHHKNVVVPPSMKQSQFATWRALECHTPHKMGPCMKPKLAAGLGEYLDSLIVRSSPARRLANNSDCS